VASPVVSLTCTFRFYGSFIYESVNYNYQLCSHEKLLLEPKKIVSLNAFKNKGSF